jgi:hypothetical protein
MGDDDDADHSAVSILFRDAGQADPLRQAIPVRGGA